MCVLRLSPRTLRLSAMRSILEERVVFLMRSIFVLLFAGFLLSSAGASAGDYTVAYAFDAGDLNDAGKTEKCEYKETCRITSDKLKLSIVLIFVPPYHNEVHVRVDGSKERLACCYFWD